MMYKLPYVIPFVHLEQSDAAMLSLIMAYNNYKALAFADIRLVSYEYISREGMHFINPNINITCENILCSATHYFYPSAESMWIYFVDKLYNKEYIFVPIDYSKIELQECYTEEFWPSIITIYGFDKYEKCFLYGGYANKRKYTLNRIKLKELYIAWRSLYDRCIEVDYRNCANRNWFETSFLKYYVISDFTSKTLDDPFCIKSFWNSEEKKSTLLNNCRKYILYYSKGQMKDEKRLYETNIDIVSNGIKVFEQIKFYIEKSLYLENYDYCPKLPYAIWSYVMLIIAKISVYLTVVLERTIDKSLIDMFNEVKEKSELLMVFALKYDIKKTERTAQKLLTLIVSIENFLDEINYIQIV